MSQEIKELLKGAVLLAPDNFTSLNRTPWAGSKIGEIYKNELVSDVVGRKIGESWEFSCDPSAPSAVLDCPFNLAELVEKFPKEILSEEIFNSSQNPSCELLVKLLDADDPLSFQVHPDDENPNLQSHECGKPESWLILNAKKDAGIYLGFRENINRGDLLEALENSRDISSFMQFVPVKENDYFDLPPGVPHAVGAGVTLLEPQRILAGKSGKTYRLWDWGRKYNSKGQFDPKNGKERELHVEACLPLLDTDRQAGPGFLSFLRKFPETQNFSDGSRVLSFPKNEYYRSERVYLKSRFLKLQLEIEGGYAAMLVLEGSVEIVSSYGIKREAKKGQAILLANMAGPFAFQAKEFSNFALLSPAVANCLWSEL